MSQKSNDPFDLNAGVPQIQGAMRPKPKFADRISKRIILVALAFVGLLVVLFLVALDHMDEKQRPRADEAKKEAGATKDTGESNKVPEELTGETGGKGSSKSAPTTLVPSASPTAASMGGVPAIGMGANPASPIPPSANPASSIPPDTAQVKPLTAEEQAAAQEKVDRLARTKQARTTGLTTKAFDVDDGGKNGAKPAAAELAMANGLIDAAKRAGAQAGPMGQPNGGEQDEKLDFIKTAGKEERGYHPHMPLPPISPNEVKAGAFVPMTLEQGINSDMPGQVTARVSEAVYDTVTGCRLLIPPMTKALGKYDSKVALGQGRNLVVWNSLIFQDGSELNLAGMEGYDPSGEAGLPADVDNHYLRTFGVTLGMSLVGAGVQLSIPQPNPAANGAAQQQTPSQIIAASLAQQYGNLGIQIMTKFLAVQPTLRNFPGERFVVMVPHTIVFNKVWRNRCEKSVPNQ